MIQQDLAPAHAARVNEELIQECGVELLEWCGNSPDLNMIEPTWPWIKRGAGHYEGFESKKDSPEIWKDLWKELPQERIRRWIERIPRHIAKIIDLKGDNGFREGAGEKPRRLNKKGQVVNSKGEVVSVDGVDEVVEETDDDDISSLDSLEEALAAIDEEDELEFDSFDSEESSESDSY